MGTCYLDYLNREVYLQEEDIEAVPESGRADEACSLIADKRYVREQFMAVPCGELKEAVCKLCDNPEIRNRHDALMYIVWLAALGIKEERASRHGSSNTKTTRDGFVWLLVTPRQARKLWEAEIFTLYRLYSDDSESMIESEVDLESTIKGGYRIGIEVGFVSVMGHAARMKQQ